jgi:hypothetical protein
MVVMGIIAVLAGLSVVIVQMMAKKGPEMKTKLTLQKVQTATNDWKSRFGAYPPSQISKLPIITNLPSTRTQRLPSKMNEGIRTLYQALNLQAFGKAVELTDEDLMNEGDEQLDKPIEGLTSPKLFEIKDAFGNPLVYIASSDYAEFEKNPPTYMATDAEGNSRPVNPKPWKSEKTGAFEQARSFQLFSMGPNGTPNDDDDLKSWSTE